MFVSGRSQVETSLFSSHFIRNAGNFFTRIQITVQLILQLIVVVNIRIFTIEPISTWIHLLTDRQTDRVGNMLWLEREGNYYTVLVQF